MSKIRASKSINSKYRSILYETEPQRLQREADGFTKKLEHAKRKQLLLEDQHKETFKKVDEKKIILNELKLTTKENHKTQAEIALIEKQLEKAIEKYNVMVNENKKLKEKINTMRKDLSAAYSAYDKMKDIINRKEKEAKKSSESRFVEKKDTEETNIQIHALKAKHDKERNEFGQKINELKEKLKERDEIKKLDERGPALDLIPTQGKSEKKEYSNPIEILNMRLEKWKSSNKEKRKIIEHFMKNSKVIEDAFEQIKEANGTSNIEEIVSTFIKSEEQNNNLYNYVNNLTQELEFLEEKKEKQEKVLKMKEEIENKKSTNKIEEEENSKKELENLRSSIIHKSQLINKYEETFRQIQSPVSEIIDIFNQTNVILTVKSDLKFNEATSFNEQNILGYMAIFEEYLDNLLSEAGKANNIEIQIHTVLPLEKIHQKVFNQRPHRIEPPLIQVSREEEIELSNMNLFMDRKTLYNKVSSAYDENAHKYF